MRKTDYQLPPRWTEMTSAEKNTWYAQERARRQAKRQRTPAGEFLRDREVEK